MKRIFTLMLSAIIFCVSMQPVLAEKNNDKLNCAINLLKYIGVVDDAVDSQLDEEISRAQFAVFAARIVGINEYGANSTRYFVDVPMKHWALNSINTLAELGIVMQPDDSKFYPDKTISATDAGVILLKIAGYDKQAALRGGYPAGYDSLISETKISAGVKSYNKMTTADACMMIYNALLTGTYQISEITSENKVGISVDEDITILSRYFDMYYAKDVVNGVDDLTLNGLAPGRGRVTIGNVIYKVDEKLDLYDYIGMKVDFFYHWEKGDDYGTVVIVQDNESYNDVVEIDLRDIDSVDNEYRIEYEYKDGRYRNVKIPKNATVIANRDMYEESIIKLLENKNGSLKLISANNSGDYNTVVVEYYINKKVSNIDLSRDELYLHGDIEPIKFQDYNQDELKLMTMDGSEIALSDLNVEDVVSVFYSESCLRMYKSTQTISGTVNAIDTTNNKLVVDDTEYETDIGFSETDKLKLGESYEFALDMNGRIAFLKSGSSKSLIYGFLVNVYPDDESDYSSLWLKIFNEEGEMVKLRTSNKLKIDGERVDINSNSIENILTVNSLIRYRTDSKGLIKEVDTSEVNKGKESEYSLHETVAKQPLLFNSAKSFAPQIAPMPNALLGKDTKIFMVPFNPQTAYEKDFSITDRNAFSVWDKRDIIAYKTDLDSPYEEVIIAFGGNNFPIEIRTPILLVESVVTELNDEDEPVEVLIAYSDGKRKSLQASVGFSFKDQGIECGDVIRIGKDSQGYVDTLEMVYDCDKNEKNENSTVYKEDFMSERRCVLGQVISKSGNVIRIGYNQSQTVDEVADLSSAKILVCDPSARKEKIRTGTIADILDFNSTGSKCSTVVTWAYIGRTDYVFVYR